MNIQQNQYSYRSSSYQSRQGVGGFQDYAKQADNYAGKTEDTATETEKPKSYREQILEKMEEMAENIRKGTIQPKFQIGAQEYTIKEWEKLLEKFDEAQEEMQEAVEEHVREIVQQAEEEAVRRAAENGMPMPGKMIWTQDSIVSCRTETAASDDTLAAAGTTAEGDASDTVDTAAAGAASGAADSGIHSGETDAAVAEKASGTADASAVEEDPGKAAALLTDEITKCSYPTEDPAQKRWYITCYSQEGISCKEAYFDGTHWINKDLWSLSYTEKGQYEKVMSFLQRFPQDANLRFAAHKNFWQDFLAGEIDEDDFAAFFETTKDGVPNYTYEKDGSTYIDREKIGYAKYMNDFGTHLYTGEEMELIQRAILHENRKGLQKLTDANHGMRVPVEATNHEDAEEDDLKTQLVTKPDGAVVLQITTKYGVMELEVTQAQKFGLMTDVRADSRNAVRNAGGGNGVLPNI